MKSEIEKILQADENAFKRVESAREKASKIKVHAQRKAEAMLAMKEKEFAEALNAEIEKTVSDARSKALEIQDATDRYLEGIRERENALSDELISNLLRKVTGL
jgi:vacuolar-type H+-ATPase subunit H